MDPKNDILWDIAKKRACFKKQLISYVFVISFLWMIWFMTSRQTDQSDSLLPWPTWIMFWWGIGLAYCFVNAYVLNTKKCN